VKDWEGLPEGFDSCRDGLQFLRMVMEGQDETQKAIADIGVRLACLVVYKNRRYGNSALDPVEVFAKGITPQQRRYVRMDDKLNRIISGNTVTDDKEDPRVDLAGYLLLDLVSDEA
jgi:hypothetical protein